MCGDGIQARAELSRTGSPAGPTAWKGWPTSGAARAAAGCAAVAALAGGLFFFHLGTYGLWEPDEARYAEIAREMLASGNFIVPHLNYVPYIEKPPLLYWLTACSMGGLGINEFGARFANAAAALLGVLATWVFAFRTFDYRRATLAGALLACSVLYAIMAQVLTTDMLLTAAMTVAMFALFLQWHEGGRWWWLGYLALGLAVLTKGPVGAGIPLLAGAIFLWAEGEGWGVMTRCHLLAGLMLAAAVSLLWFVAIAIRQPDFVNFYFVGEHLRRFMQTGYSHGEPIYYYLPVIAGGFLPWSLAVPLVPWNSLEPNPARRFCVIATATVLVLFSLANAKLVPYILPAFPFLAVMTADGLMAFSDARWEAQSNRRRDPRRIAAVMALLVIAGLAAIAVASKANRFASPYPLMVRPALYAGGTAVTLCASVGFAAFWARRYQAGVVLLLAAAAATIVSVSYGRIMAEPTRSYAELARTIERLAPDARLICYPRYIQSLPFYCGRRVILVGAKTELAYGARHSPDASEFFFTHREELLRLWKEPQATVLVIDRAALGQLQSSLGRYKVVASDSKKLALTRERGEGQVKGSPSDSALSSSASAKQSGRK